MNKVMLVGRLTRDPELRMASGSAVCNFSIAVDSGFNSKTGETITEFINCSVWGKQADNLSKYCTKGSLISVVGRLRNNSYTTQDGSKRNTIDVSCDEIRFLGSKKSGDSYSRETNYESMPQNDVMPTADLTEDPFKSFSEEITLSNDDLPF